MDLTELTEAFKTQGLKPQQITGYVHRAQELVGQGFDLSSLFPSIVACTSTRDIPTKKAVFQFLMVHGHNNEDLCLLAINTLLLDCKDPDPAVRALALRTICGLRLHSFLRLALQPLYNGLQDKTAHVRKTAAMCCISVYKLDPGFVLESDIVDRLYAMIRDKDCQVAVHAILALETILEKDFPLSTNHHDMFSSLDPRAAESTPSVARQEQPTRGGMIVTATMAKFLLGRFKEWSTSQLQVILSILCRFQPESDEQIYDLLNDIDDGLQHPSMAVQLASLKLFIVFCQDLAEIHEQVRSTILTVLTKHLAIEKSHGTTPPYDLMHASLQHLSVFVQRDCTLFDQNPASLAVVCCQSVAEPVEIQLLKMKILGTVGMHASVETAKLIVDELARYIIPIPNQGSSVSTRMDISPNTVLVKLACRSAETIGRIAMSVSHRGTRSFNPRLWHYALENLFQVLAILSGLDKIETKGAKKSSSSATSATTTSTTKDKDRHNPTTGRDTKRHTSSSSSQQIPLSITDIMDEGDIAKITSCCILVVEQCWQFGTNQQVALALGLGTGLLNAYQVKILGTLLLRHLDQEDLDRRAKRNPKLKYSHSKTGDTSGGATGGGMLADYSDWPQHQSRNPHQDHHHAQEANHFLQSNPNDISVLSRIAGIRVLLIEEASKSLLLPSAFSSPLAENTLSTVQQGTTTSLATSSSSSSSSIRTLLAIDSEAVRARSLYWNLLRMQVQDLLQSVYRTGHGANLSDDQRNTATLEQLGLLKLGCHLVALSLLFEGSLEKNKDNSDGHEAESRTNKENKEKDLLGLGLEFETITNSVDTNLKPSRKEGDSTLSVSSGRAKLWHDMEVLNQLVDYFLETSSSSSSLSSSSSSKRQQGSGGREWTSEEYSSWRLFGKTLVSVQVQDQAKIVKSLVLDPVWDYLRILKEEPSSSSSLSPLSLSIHSKTVERVERFQKLYGVAAPVPAVDSMTTSSASSSGPSTVVNSRMLRDLRQKDELFELGFNTLAVCC